MTNPTIAELYATIADLEVALDQAAQVQWRRSPRSPRPKQERVSGGPVAPADPTADIALDDLRLAVRDAVTKSEYAVRLATGSLSAQAARVRSTLAAWEGTDLGRAEG